MKASVLLNCNSQNIKYLPYFIHSLNNQTQPVFELIVRTDKANAELINQIKKICSNVEFSLDFVSDRYYNEHEKYDLAFKKFSGDYVLFAYAQHPFNVEKVEQFSRYFYDDPYLRFAFTNLEIIDDTNQIIILDYFGITGFYERWDIFKPLTKVMAKQIGFIKDYQIGITAKTIQKLQKFKHENSITSNLKFDDFLSTFIAVRYNDTIKEIPYVLTQMRLSAEEIEKIRISKRNLDYKPIEQINWLNDYQQLIEQINDKHKVLNYISKAKDFHQKRIDKIVTNKVNVVSALGNFIIGNYSKFSFEPINLLKQDINI